MNEGSRRWARVGAAVVMAMAMAAGDAASSPVAPPPMGCARLTALPLGDVRVRDGARLRSRRDDDASRLRGPGVASPFEDPAAALSVVAEDARGVRVCLDGGSARLLLWVDRADLQTVVTRTVALAGRPGLSLRAGAPVAVTSSNRRRARVRLVDTALAVDGEVPASAIGAVFVADATSRPEGTARGLTDTVVRATPGARGRPLLTVRAPTPVAAIGAPRDGWQEVALATDAVIARGFAPVAALAPPPRRTFADALFSDEVAGAGQRVVAAGSCLFDRPGGSVIGVATANAVLAMRPAEPGWWLVTVVTSRGQLEVAVGDGADGASCASRVVQ